MEYESPVRVDSMTYSVPVHTTKYLDVKYSSTVSGSHTTPPLDSFECMAYIADMSTIYEEYSKKWFNRAILSIFFVKNVAHEWNHLTHAPYTSPPKFESVPIQVHQVWRPVKITVEVNKYTIHWRLMNSKFTEHALESAPSGETAAKSEEVPYGRNQVVMVLKRTSRSQYHRKIRKARVVLAAAQVRLHTLLLRYTEKYGELDNTSDSDSVLSFGSGDN